MPATCKIVDKIDASPTVRLDLNDGTTWRVVGKPDFSPPPLKRAVVSTLLRDGAEIPSTAYENRVLGLELVVTAADQDALATQLQTFNREMDRRTNILKYQPVGATNPVFFRTFRSPDYRMEIGTGDVAFARIRAAIVAEPFAYGLRVDSGLKTVNNDPAAGSNPMYFDVVGVAGDVPTPALIAINGSPDLPTAIYTTFVVATRRHGTPGDVTWFRQVESLSLSGDTSSVADANASGGNAAECTFATNPTTMAPRAEGYILGTAGGGAGDTDRRGTYRAYVRADLTVTTDDIEVQLKWAGVGAAPEIANDVVTLTGSGGYRWLDLGLVQMPPGHDPLSIGYGEEAPCEALLVGLHARRVSGTGYIRMDYLILVPADEEMCIASWQVLDDTAGKGYMDGPNDALYFEGSGGALGQIDVPTRVGTIPMLAPNQTNRVFWMLARDRSKMLNNISDTSKVTVSFWPRFLYVRP